MKKLFFLTILFSSLALCRIASASEGDEEVAIFSCDVLNGRKFVELCASSPVGGENGYLVYRFGTQDANSGKRTIELEYPAEKAGSFKRFFGATYTCKSVYTQSVRFVSGEYSYTVFTRASNRAHNPDRRAGVEVRNLHTGKTITEDCCCDWPRFYIYELKGILPGDPETPVGPACIH